MTVACGEAPEPLLGSGTAAAVALTRQQRGLGEIVLYQVIAVPQLDLYLSCYLVTFGGLKAVQFALNDIEKVEGSPELQLTGLLVRDLVGQLGNLVPKTEEVISSKISSL